MRAWWGLIAGVGLIALGYGGDRIGHAVLVEATRTFTSDRAVVLDGVARVIAVGLMVGLGWFVLRGPRERLVGIVMVAIGGYVAFAPSLMFTLLANIGIDLPFAAEALAAPTDLMLWAGAVVLVLGVIELVWPTPPAAT